MKHAKAFYHNAVFKNTRKEKNVKQQADKHIGKETNRQTHAHTLSLSYMHTHSYRDADRQAD